MVTAARTIIASTKSKKAFFVKLKDLNAGKGKGITGKGKSQGNKKR